MHNYKSFYYIFPLILMFTLLLHPGSAFSGPAEDLLSKIKSRQEQLTRHQSTLERLSAEERDAYSRLAEAEDRLDKISRTLEARENELDDIIFREAETAGRYEKLSGEIASTRKELAELLQNIWPIFLESQGKGLAEIMQWSDLDREMTWLRAIYLEAEKIYSLLQAQSMELSASLDKLQTIKDEFRTSFDEVNATKDRLLTEKLAFLRELQEIRAQKLAGEEIITEIIDAIDSLNYQMNIAAFREFEDLKGNLIWPANGMLVSSYNPSDNPPHNGLSISLEENSPVQAISWGKVMHNDTLRGFGRVIILNHGENYYTLYAYLSESSLQIGQEVEKGEDIGRSGYYPKINSHGIYFELRFKQKAINPIPWLAKS
jgi:murein hydrolase activator